MDRFNLPLGGVALAGHDVRTVHEDKFLSSHLVQGERAGFIRANNAGAAKRFNAGESFHDGVLFCHSGCTDGQRNGSDGG